MNEAVRNVITTMAISNMELDEEFIWELQKIAEGKVSPEEVQKEILEKYKRGDD